MRHRRSRRLLDCGVLAVIVVISVVLIVAVVVAVVVSVRSHRNASGWRAADTPCRVAPHQQVTQARSGTVRGGGDAAPAPPRSTLLTCHQEAPC